MYDNDPCQLSAPSCPECDEMEEKKLHAKEYFQSILNHLYGKGSLDLIELENDLDELCYYLDVKTVPGDLNIERRKAKQESAHKQFITFMKE